MSEFIKLVIEELAAAQNLPQVVFVDPGPGRSQNEFAPAPSKPFGMDLYLRKVIHQQAHENYRVILKCEDGDFEIGSIGIQHAAGASYFWAWGIETVIPMRTHQTQGKDRDRKDCMRQFRAAWERFASVCLS